VFTAFGRPWFCAEYALLHGATNEMKKQTTKAGIEIPVPKRGDFLANLKKAATPTKSKNRRAAKKR
jgi:hypothetical protein